MKGMVLLLGAVVAFHVGTGAARAQSCPDDVGATLAAACPCDADGQGRAWKNHGQYVKCVVQLRNRLRKAGCLDAMAKRTIASCAARSTCGKEGAVLCCVYDTSATCSDPIVDGVAAGTCSDDGSACDSSTDCIRVVSGPKLKRQTETCTDRGGTAVGGGSVCGGCPLPPPVP